MASLCNTETVPPQQSWIVIGGPVFIEHELLHWYVFPLTDTWSAKEGSDAQASQLTLFY